MSGNSLACNTCVVAVAFTRPYTPPSIYERPCITCSTTFSYAHRETFHSGRGSCFSRIVPKASDRRPFNYCTPIHGNLEWHGNMSWFSHLQDEPDFQDQIFQKQYKITISFFQIMKIWYSGFGLVSKSCCVWEWQPCPKSWICPLS